MSLSLNNSLVLILLAFSLVSFGVALPSSCRTCLAIKKFEELHKKLENLAKEVKGLTEKSKGLPCTSSWDLVFENDRSGQQVSGSRSELIKNVQEGDSVRVLLSNFTMEADFIHVYHGEVFVQLLQSVSMASWNRFQTDSQWVWSIVSTSGVTQEVRYNVGSNSFKGEKLDKAAIKWFTKKTTCDSQPVYSHDHSGNCIVGNLSNLMKSVREGADLRCVSSHRSAAFSVQNVAMTKTFVSGQTLNHVSIQRVPNQNALRFQNNAYWWFTMYTTQGTRDMSRWTVGEHVSRGHTQDRVDIDWFADLCWKRAYSNDKNGRATFGSRSSLVAAIKAGSRVRVQFSSFYTVEADNLSIRKGHVTAQVLKHISKQDLIKMQDDAYWFWQMISTTGTVRSYRYYVGKHKHLSTTKDSQEVHWFVDTRPWKLVYYHDAKGQGLHGSKQDLVSAVHSGAAIRGYYDSSPNDAYAFAFQRLQVHGQHVAGQHLNSVSMQRSTTSQYEMEIQPNAYWWFVTFTTEGRSDMIRWSVGEHTARGHNTGGFSIKWFANY